MAVGSAGAAASRAPSGGQKDANAAKVFRPDGELLRVVIPAECSLTTAFHQKGVVASYAWWLEYAQEFGVSFQLRGRKKRRPGAAPEKTGLIITGPQGSTRRFYQELRDQMALLLGGVWGLPLAHRVYVHHIGLDGVTMERSMAVDGIDQLACVGEPWFCCWWTCLKRPAPSVAEAAPAPAEMAGVAGPPAISAGASASHGLAPALPATSSASPGVPSLPGVPGKVVNIHIVYAGLRYLANVTKTDETSPHT